MSDSTFSYGNNETYRVLTDIKGEKYIELSITEFRTDLGSLEEGFESNTPLAETKTYFYKVIPYYSTDTYLEYTNEYIEENNNASEGLYVSNSNLSLGGEALDVNISSIKHLFGNSSQEITDRLSSNVIATNNKYIYSILRLTENSVSINFANLIDDSLIPIAYHVDAKSVEIGSNNRNYLVYKNPVTINGKQYRFAVVTGLYRDITPTQLIQTGGCSTQKNTLIISLQIKINIQATMLQCQKF